MQQSFLKFDSFVSQAYRFSRGLILYRNYFLIFESFQTSFFLELRNHRQLYLSFNCLQRFINSFNILVYGSFWGDFRQICRDYPFVDLITPVRTLIWIRCFKSGSKPSPLPLLTLLCHQWSLQTPLASRLLTPRILTQLRKQHNFCGRLERSSLVCGARILFGRFCQIKWGSRVLSYELSPPPWRGNHS